MSSKFTNLLLAVIIIVLLIFVITLVVEYYFLQNKNIQEITKPENIEYHQAVIAGKEIKLETANTFQERIKGLSDRDNLEKNTGLLFVFQEEGYYEIWMKDMKFPIDVMWINKNKEIVYIVENMRPESFPKTFTSLSPAYYILEVNAGFIDENNIKTGDSIKLY